MTDNRYYNSKVYKLIDDEGYYYYGCTCMPLHKRRYHHQEMAKRKPHRKIYTMFTNDRFLKGEIKIVLVEELKLENKEQLLRAENNYIQQSLDDSKCLNRYHSLLTDEQKKEYDRQWYQANRNKILENQKTEERRQQRNSIFICECGSKTTQQNIARHKKSQKHSDYINNKNEI